MALLRRRNHQSVQHYWPIERTPVRFGPLHPISIFCQRPPWWHCFFSFQSSLSSDFGVKTACVESSPMGADCRWVRCGLLQPCPSAPLLNHGTSVSRRHFDCNVEEARMRVRVERSSSSRRRGGGGIFVIHSGYHNHVSEHCWFGFDFPETAV